ncbi:protoheme IX farnesyltransferase [Sulfitobacter pseudonitzschiae]|uniref:Protoheme IX farnesyltransferase n=1 Tax=Pseudosulfitobacter pseudonitzschiae TaxID=1402135 RepID=A0A9Q2RRM2_9RHOB|nr:heme o synthase [Pseudosulfitobacter pseudonitzschiae]MBM2291471.1 protoheme IX farnesyltransferase [Pseudosulfitobacter pseudonitzschiae]MBM2296389.1 protoheme IX farnesyltransferase [Pseudosulfitobacter pseudonitzschiae]MBM2301302.1 protoheme IX farnesyltransferase [Pseudosulfitobacter pseudonitzschiae]MBM2311086.1 protoheme IX farnesyltransferase [Pseudosulfitobacter pseudonitzschiae]MBM2315999.1 protoheme IX farnesyltransferase [Pseudosulfitobacter pseudonitzschiae]|tara:strand:- start:1301 stop:2239 length:939 start_codon:yes stop_codon:yes gene_type:complete
MTDISSQPQAFEGEASFGDYFALMKPRVMQLVVFTALVGMLAAPNGVNPVVGFASILFIAIGAGASGALNMWWDADIDHIMKRTANRPIPSGKVQPGEALSIGVALSGLSVMMLALSANLLAAGLLAFTIFFYAVIYSMWLKRSTPQNIVIGGAAGAFPPVIGWVVATGSMSVEAWLMFALIFMWTPPHFWALALFMKSDYDDAKVPMLTVTHGRKSTRKHILAYTVLLVILAVGTAFTSIGGLIYLTTAVILNVLFLKGAFDIWRRDETQAEADGYAVEKSFFKLSLLYLFLHFGAIMAEALLRSSGYGGW